MPDVTAADAVKDAGTAEATPGTPAVFDAVVVGAGMAGLTAARALQDRGRSVRVLESRDRVGGRLLTVAGAEGHLLDLGATWYWPGEHRVAALVQELGQPVHPQHLAGDALFHEPSGRQRLNGNPIDVPSGRFSLGAEALARGLADLLAPGTIELGRPVTAIELQEGDSDRGGVRVITATGSVRAEHVVVALPPALAVHRLHFAPALPDRLTGLAEATPVWMASVAKVVARYERPFWREQGLSGAAISHLGPMGEIHDMSGPDGHPAALFGFARLPRAGDPPPQRAAVEAQLATLFGPDAPAPVEVLIHDWRAEGETAPLGVDPSSAYQLFGHPRYQEPSLGGRLHWASTETATVSPGHIEGAMASGERAAAAIVAATEPSATRSAS
jgi:monoamine oxidase